MNGVPVNSCLIPVFTLSDAEIVTVEGIHSLKSFVDIRKKIQTNRIYGCGFCSSGIQVALAALLLTNLKPTEAEIRQALSGNLCACGNYNSVVAAVLEGSRRKRRYGVKQR
jgi:aerobic-type carbon monoxide dehydrogenase small subunit (CoxS/CutS family)